MYLVDTTTIEMHPFTGEIPKYVILSHTWGNEEVTFEAMHKLDKCTKDSAGYRKIVNSCGKAKEDGYRWVWVDTCCIDKRSSAELSEAINSMYRYYWEAEKCYAYLSDVPTLEREIQPTNMVADLNRHGIGTQHEMKYVLYDNGRFAEISAPSSGLAGQQRDTSGFETSRWFKRGWTLQELLAPTTLEFYNSNWTMLGTKSSLAATIETATKIQRRYILDRSAIKKASLGLRLSWASGRKTSREEDIAYCLFGIVGVNMPLLYGEGKRAFHRLQVELLKTTMDHTIFAWSIRHGYNAPDHRPVRYVGLLATTPFDFQPMHLADIRPFLPRTIHGSKHDVTNVGLRIVLPCIDIESDTILALLHCQRERETLVGIRLKQLDDQRFVRDQFEDLSTVSSFQAAKAELRTLYILTEADEDLELNEINPRKRKLNHVTLESLPCAFRLNIRKPGDKAADRPMTSLTYPPSFYGRMQSSSLPCVSWKWDQVVTFRWDTFGRLNSQVYRDSGDAIGTAFIGSVQPLVATGIVVVYSIVNLIMVFGHRKGRPWLEVFTTSPDTMELRLQVPRKVENDKEFAGLMKSSMKRLQAAMELGVQSNLCRDHAVADGDSGTSFELQAKKKLEGNHTCWELEVTEPNHNIPDGSESQHGRGCLWCRRMAGS